MRCKLFRSFLHSVVNLSFLMRYFVNKVLTSAVCSNWKDLINYMYERKITIIFADSFSEPTTSM